MVMKNAVNIADSDPLGCICVINASNECLMSVGMLVRTANAQLWRNHKTSSEYLAGADFYTVVILSLFASIISLLLIRAIKPNETLDDQVTILLNSMRVRVEIEDSVRQRRKLREAKEKAQRWLQEAKQRSAKSFSFRKTRSTSESETMRATSEEVYEVRKASKQLSLPRNAAGPGHKSHPPRLHPYGRAASHLGFVPEIVVTPEIVIQRPTAATPVESASRGRRLSRYILLAKRLSLSNESPSSSVEIA
ncbi:unnamed protein product [Toxocara canis]|uniref:Uncharacterized protein n=1 Tax=Toxocara canis TaxID=6265 RepID=A0A3P7GBR1_TOXCA|nr:unnamed protein product [Toxocara canis]